MSKTPEQTAEEAIRWVKTLPPASERCNQCACEGYRAGYQAAQQWISVKDRLPKMEHGFAMRQESECVLIACNDNVHVAHLCEKWCDRTQVVFEACDCDCRGHDMEQDEWELDKVSHWQLLPAPPKEEK